MLRTQIYLPKDLREKIDRQRASSGESLADYLRKAAEDRVEKDEKKKENLKKLAEEVFGKTRKNPISEKRANEWIKQIRKDRELEDKHLDEKWAKALKK